MRAIIIEDKDAHALLDQLKLELIQKYHLPHNLEEKPPTMNEMHRAFHYIVVRWLQEQGCSTVRQN